jgi:hypothetical protein
MGALREIRGVRQVPGERQRRWFASEDMDLIVWHEADAPVSFQLCYDKGRRERALTCTADGALSHAYVDDGESRNSGYKEVPVLVDGGSFDPERVERLFIEASARLPAPITALVLEAIRRHPGARRA